MTYILTHSGAKVSHLEGAPEARDVAIALSRMPRFAGHTRRWWSVLDHSLFMERLVVQHARTRGFSDYSVAEAGVHALLHDAHEAITGDIPSPFKPLDTLALQRDLDDRIGAALVPERPDILKYDRDFISEFDQAALLVEAYRVGPPDLDSLTQMREHFGGRPNPNDMALFTRGLLEGDFGHPPVLAERWNDNAGVRRFFERLRNARQVLAAGPFA